MGRLVAVSSIRAKRSADLYGKGLSRTASTILKTDVTAPFPRAKIETTDTMNTGFRPSHLADKTKPLIISYVGYWALSK